MKPSQDAANAQDYYLCPMAFNIILIVAGEKIKMVLFEDKEVTIVSKAEAMWIKAKESTENRIKMVEENLIIDRAFLELCKEKIKEEQSFQEQVNNHETNKKTTKGN